MTLLATMKGKMFAALAAAALAACILPASAFAATINVYDGAGTDTLLGSIVTDGSSANVTLNSGEVDALYNKSGWKKLAGTQYFTLDSALTTVAPVKWAATSYLTFDTQETAGVQAYTKYNSGHFTKAEVTGLYHYYPLVEWNSVAPLDNSTDITNAMALAFTWGTADIAEYDADEEDAINAGNTSVTTTSHSLPRVIWGLSGTTPDSSAGNRLPSNVYAIHLY